MFSFVVNFWNVRHHTGKIKNLIFFHHPRKKCMPKKKKTFHAHFRNDFSTLSFKT